MATTVSLNGTNYTVPENGEGDWGNSLAQYLQQLAQAKSGMLVFGNANTPNASGTTYLAPCYLDDLSEEQEFTIRAPANGKISAVYVQADTGPTGGDLVFTVRKNKSDTALTCTLAAAATQASDVAHSVTFLAGDRISVKAVSTASTGADHVYLTLCFTPS